MSLTYVKMNNKIVYLQVMALITFLATPFMISLGILSAYGVFFFQMINLHLYTCVMSKFKNRNDHSMNETLDTSPLCGMSNMPSVAQRCHT